MLNHAIPVKDPLINIDPSVATDIVSAIYNVADFMKEEIARHKLISNNRKSGLYWDKLNTNMHDTIATSGGASDIVRVGFHQFLLARYGGYRFTLMREARFFDVMADVKADGKLSYQNLLVQLCNRDLEAEVAQMTMYPFHEYDTDEISTRINRLFGSVQENDDSGYYVMILFDIYSDFELRKIKAVIVDPNFDVVEEQDWSHYIPVEGSVIVEQVSDVKAPSNNPSRGITLKPKAFELKSKRDESPSEDDKE